MKRYEYRILDAVFMVFHYGTGKPREWRHEEDRKDFERVQQYLQEGFRWVRSEADRAVFERVVDDDSVPAYRLGDCARDEAIAWLADNLAGDHLTEALDWMLQWANLRASNILRDLEDQLREVATKLTEIEDLCTNEQVLELAINTGFVVEQALKRTLLARNQEDEDGLADQGVDPPGGSIGVRDDD